MDAETTVPDGEQSVDALSYEQAFAELEAVVSALEREEHSLEESLALYARGRALLAHCRRLLERAELQVRMLTEEGTLTDLPAETGEG